jgi:hypothetical protein
MAIKIRMAGRCLMAAKEKDELGKVKTKQEIIKHPGIHIN